MSDDGMPDLSDLYGEFVSENQELLQNLTNELVSLEASPDDPDIINRLFRYAHTLKGNAGFIGLTPLSEIAHRMEDVLDKLRDRELVFFPEINDVFFRALDIASSVLEDFIAGKEEFQDLSIIAADLDGLLEGPKEIALVEEAGAVTEEAVLSKEEKVTHEAKEASFMRVSTDRLDSIVNMVGELATGRSRLLQLSSELKNEELIELASYIKNVSSRLQDEVLSIRMVPVKDLFNRFFRLIRDTSRSLGKDVRLVVKGENTELDKSITELLYDPLVHLIRNSIGHGIESADVRSEKGKDKLATITLNAYHEHNSIYIQVTDDGKGLDISEIRRKAVEKGIASEEAAEAFSEDEVARLIFGSGFSTARDVDSVSGRGVGMDVVRSNIEKIGGDVGLAWEEGKGTTVTIRAPLTLAIVQLFLVRQGKQIFGIPLSYVDETIMVKDKDLEYMKGQMVYMLRRHPVPILRLSETFSMKEVDVEESDGKINNIIILNHLNMRGGIIIDEFMGKVETVIKPLGTFIERLPDSVHGVSGASILGSGEIVLVIDVPALWKML